MANIIFGILDINDGGLKMKIWIFLAGLLSPVLSYGQEVCSAGIKNYLKQFEDNIVPGSISRPNLINQIIIHRAPNQLDERWMPFHFIQVVDLDADGKIEIIGRLRGWKQDNYRDRMIILNYMSQSELDKIIDSGDVWPSRFFSNENFRDNGYLYSENNGREIMPDHVFTKVLKGYDVAYKEIFLVNRKAYVLVSVVGDTKTTRKYFVFKLNGTRYSEYCKYE